MSKRRALVLLLLIALDGSYSLSCLVCSFCIANEFLRGTVIRIRSLPLLDAFFSHM